MKSHPNAFSLRRLLAAALLFCACAAALDAPAAARTSAVEAALVNAASYDAARVLAPGSIGALFSQGLMEGDPISASTLPLPTSLGGLTVRIDGVQARLFFVSSGQINLQVPGSVDLGPATVEVFRAGTAEPVATGAITIAAAAPGVFTFSNDGHNQAAALNADYSLNADFERFPGSRPEVTGQFVTIYATGVGRTTVDVGDGEPAPVEPLAVADAPTTVMIGDVAAQVLYSGLAPGFVGLWQISAVLPANLPTNLTTSLKVEHKGGASQPTTLAVANQKDVGTVSGTVVSAMTGAAIGGAEVTLQTAGDESSPLRRAATNAQGEYSFLIVMAGNYDVRATAAGFIPAAQTASIGGASETELPPIALTEPLAANQYRVVVTWTGGIDLDAHLTGPGDNQTRFHVWWNGETDLKTPATAQFDRDDQTGAGPETITFTAQPGGIYRFSVQDYSNRDTDGSMGLGNARATVRVFFGNQQVAVLTPPSGGGTLWRVFELSNGQLNLVNQLGDEPDPSNIKVSF